MLRILAFLLLTTFAQAADWPEFMGPTRDQVSAETGLIDAFPENGPRLVWEKVVGKGYSAPSVRGELLIVHHRSGKEEIVEAWPFLSHRADEPLDLRATGP